MSYIQKSLKKDEKIISESKYHWWYLSKEIFYFLLLIVPGFYCYYRWTLNTSYAEYWWLVMLHLFIFSVWPFLRLFYFWIVRLTTEQAVTTERICKKSGIISRDTDELEVQKIESISIKQTILGRFLNFGEIIFTGTGDAEIIFKYVTSPAKRKREVEQ